MIIGVHIRKDSFDRYQENFNLSCVSRLAALLFEHSFILLADKQQQIICNEPNCTVVKLPLIRNRFQKYFLNHYRLPQILKKNKADLFIPAANDFCSSCDIKQIVIIQDLRFILPKKRKDKRIVSTLVTNPAFEGLEHLNYPAKKTVHGMHPDFRPLNPDEKNEIKKKYTEDYEYFFTEITTGKESDLMIILKAFSIFKKWQKSSLKLVVLLHGTEHNNPVHDFNLYKFRNDVIIIYDSQTKQLERASLFAAAYASILTDYLQVIASIKCHVPPVVIGTVSDAYGASALYSPGDEKSIANRIIEIYKNEMLRNTIVTNGTHLSLEYTWENAAAQLRNAIENTI